MIQPARPATAARPRAVSKPDVLEAQNCEASPWLRSGDNPDAFVFPGAKPGKPLSNMFFLMLSRRVCRGDLPAHGFRATFTQ